MLPQPIPQKFAFFADEAGISQDRYTVVGGCCIRREAADSVYADILDFRRRYGMSAEMKWSKISNQKVEAYEAFVDLFFALNKRNRVQFHAVIFDSHKRNDKLYNDGDRDVGLSKLYYQLLLHKFIRRCGNAGDLFACLDRRNSSTPLEDLRNMLNAGAAKSCNIHHAPLKQLISRDSKQDDILQLNDVILGAVCAVRNGKHVRKDSRESKKYIAQKVLANCGLDSFERDSPKGVNRFTVWNFQPRARKK